MRVAGQYQTRRRNESKGRARTDSGEIWRPRGASASPARLILDVRRGGARAFTLGPERW